MKHQETTISQLALLDILRLLNWPKSLHHLGLQRTLLWPSYFNMVLLRILVSWCFVFLRLVSLQKLYSYSGNLQRYIQNVPVENVLHRLLFQTNVTKVISTFHSWKVKKFNYFFTCVTYQIQEVAGELFENEDFASHLSRLRVWFLNRFRPEIQKKPNLYK